MFRQKEQCEHSPPLADSKRLPAISAFVDLLNEMRFGRLSKQNKSRLMALSREVKYTDSVEPTELYVPEMPIGEHALIYLIRRFPTKREVQFANESRLNKLGGTKHTFNASDRAGVDDKGRDIPHQQAKAQLDRCVLAPETMILRVSGIPALEILPNGLMSPTLGRRTGDVDQGTKRDRICNTRSYTRIERRAGSTGQRLSGKSY